MSVEQMNYGPGDESAQTELEESGWPTEDQNNDTAQTNLEESGWPENQPE